VAPLADAVGLVDHKHEQAVGLLQVAQDAHRPPAVRKLVAGGGYVNVPG
jgi:hypothetical protein